MTMKLRLRKNSIRLRLLQSEIAKLKETGAVSETIIFNESQKITYMLSVSEAAKQITARFENSAILVEIPRELSDEWTTTELIGLRNRLKAGDDATLEITLEKDFVCLERPSDADNADAFPHPKTNC